MKYWHRLQSTKDGLLAERVTGMQLNRLLSQGCTVMHDLPADGFNIDHVVTASRGVYAVETKSFRKPKQAEQGQRYAVKFDGSLPQFPDFKEMEALAQAKRRAAVASWLSARGSGARGSGDPRAGTSGMASGSARRGLALFAGQSFLSYAQWIKLHGKGDRESRRRHSASG